MNIHELYRQYAEVLTEQQTADAAHGAAYTLWEREHATIVHAKKTADEKAKALEAQMREAVATHVAAGGTLDGLDGITIQMRQGLVYDAAEVTKACLRLAPFLLTVDEKLLKEFVGNINDSVGTIPEYLNWLPVAFADKPTPAIRKVALTGWLDEQRYKTTHAVESTDEKTEDDPQVTLLVETPPASPTEEEREAVEGMVVTINKIVRTNGYWQGFTNVPSPSLVVITAPDMAELQKLDVVGQVDDEADVLLPSKLIWVKVDGWRIDSVTVNGTPHQINVPF